MDKQSYKEIIKAKSNPLPSEQKGVGREVRPQGEIPDEVFQESVDDKVKRLKKIEIGHIL